jgi:iron(III) transport system permease protein
MYPLIYLNLRSVLTSIPLGLHEAARLNGFSIYSIWKLIDYGLLKGAVVGSMIFVFVGSITDVGTPLLLERRDFISTSIFQTLVDAPPQGAGYALCVLVLVMSVFSFLFVNLFERKFPGVIDARISRIEVPKEDGVKLKFIFLVIFAVLVSLVGVIPHITVVILAFSDYWFLTPLPTSYTFTHFIEVFSHPLSKSSLFYSLFLASIASIICLLAGLWVAWRAARIGSVWDKYLEAACILPLAVPGIVIAFGMVLGYAGTWIDNRNNPTILLIMAYAVRKLPFMVRVAKSAILLIPKGLEEAAFLAGASSVTIIRHIVAPLLKPAIIAGLFLSFTGALLEVSDSLLLPMEEKFYPITKALYSLQARPDGVSLSAAYALVVMGAIILILLLASKLSGKKITELLRGAT